MQDLGQILDEDESAQKDYLFDLLLKKKSLIFPCVQTSSRAHPASYPMVTGGPFPGGRTRPGRDADHSPPSSAEVKYEWELHLLSPQAPP
jgi:hypothetical protein